VNVVVSFCEECYDVAKFHSPITLLAWKTLCLCALNSGRPLHVTEFINVMFHVNGVKKSAVNRCALILEEAGYLLTHENEIGIWVIPRGLKRHGTNHIFICAECH
jgi:hypothetical protein